MNLKEIQEALLEQAARNVTLANEIGKLIGKVASQYVEVNWKDLCVGDTVRVTYENGDVAEETVYVVESNYYSGLMPFAVESKGWLTSASDYSDPEETFVKLEKLV